MKIEIEVSEDNESTSFPWWFIVNPGRGFLSNPEHVAHCITGPFFSREEATEQLTRRRYDYGKNAIVWCGSGYHTGRYRAAFKIKLRMDKGYQVIRSDGVIVDARDLKILKEKADKYDGLCK